MGEGSNLPTIAEARANLSKMLLEVELAQTLLNATLAADTKVEELARRLMVWQHKADEDTTALALQWEEDGAKRDEAWHSLFAEPERVAYRRLASEVLEIAQAVLVEEIEG